MDQREPANTCPCGCGKPVKPGNTWLRGHAARGVGGYRPGQVDPLPPPGAPDEDFGIIDIGDPDESPSTADAGPGAEAVPEPGPTRDEDEPPAHARRDWHRASRPARGKPPRVTQAIRTDIDAKISLALEIPGRVWEARDPVCGGTFVAQREAISASLTNIVCQSSDLVAWFAGSGGNFMLALDLAAACWPVVTMIMAHHVYHSLEEETAGPLQPDTVRYAA